MDILVILEAPTVSKIGFCVVWGHRLDVRILHTVWDHGHASAHYAQAQQFGLRFIGDSDDFVREAGKRLLGQHSEGASPAQVIEPVLAPNLVPGDNKWSPAKEGVRFCREEVKIGPLSAVNYIVMSMSEHSPC